VFVVVAIVSSEEKMLLSENAGLMRAKQVNKKISFE